MINVELVNLKKVQLALRNQPEKINLVLSRAINRAATNAKSNMSKKVREEYVVKASDVKKTINISKATSSNPSATVKSTGNRLDLVDFKLTPKNLFKGQNNYSVQVHKSGGLKKVPGFAAASNKWGLFMRAGAKQYPIKRLMGPSVPQMIGHESVITWIEQEASSMLNQRVQHELEQVLGARSV